MTTTINVLAHAVLDNKRDGKNRPVIVVRKDYGTERERTIECHHAEILGPSRLVYRPNESIAGGAKVWIETDSEVLTS